MKQKKRSSRVIKTLVPVALVLLVIAAFVVNAVTVTPPTVPEGTAQVHFIDVGQGDCELIRTADANILIDAGPTDKRYSAADYVRRSAGHLDLVILTHPHEDHIGGAAEVIRAVGADKVMMTDETSDEACFARLREAVADIPVIRPERGQIISFGKLKLTVLSAGTDSGDENDMSIVVRMDYGDTSFLFTGDAGEDAEGELLKSPGMLDCDVLKAGHHGSASSTTADFVRAVTPQIAVIEAGKDNAFGHPAKATLDRLSEAKIYRTDRDGTVILTTNGNSIKVFEDS